MTFEELDRLVYCLRHNVPLPFDLSVELADALERYLRTQREYPIGHYLQIPLGHSPIGKIELAARDDLYRRLAKTMQGSADDKARHILDYADGCRVGDFTPAEIGGKPFESFMADFHRLGVYHCSRRSLRRAIAA